MSKKIRFGILGLVVFVAGALGFWVYQIQKLKPEAEKIINATFEDLGALFGTRYLALKYEPFKCDGVLFLTCKSPSITFGDEKEYFSLSDNVIEVSSFSLDNTKIKFLTQFDLVSLEYSKIESSFPGQSKLALDLEFSKPKEGKVDWEVMFKSKANKVDATMEVLSKGVLLSESLKNHDSFTIGTFANDASSEFLVNYVDFKLSDQMVAFLSNLNSFDFNDLPEVLKPQKIGIQGNFKISPEGDALFVLGGNVKNAYFDGSTSWKGKIKQQDKITDLLSLINDWEEGLYLTQVDLDLKGKDLYSIPDIQQQSFKEFMANDFDLKLNLKFQEEERLLDTSMTLSAEADAYKYQGQTNIVFGKPYTRRPPLTFRTFLEGYISQPYEIKSKSIMESKEFKEKAMKALGAKSDEEYEKSVDNVIFMLFREFAYLEDQKTKELLDSMKKEIKDFAMGKRKRIEFLVQNKEGVKLDVNSFQEMLESLDITIK